MSSFQIYYTCIWHLDAWQFLHLWRSLTYYYLIFWVNFAPWSCAVLTMQWLSMCERWLGGREVTEWELPLNGHFLNHTYHSPLHTVAMIQQGGVKGGGGFMLLIRIFEDSCRQTPLILSCRRKSLCTLTPTHTNLHTVEYICHYLCPFSQQYNMPSFACTQA